MSESFEGQTAVHDIAPGVKIVIDSDPATPIILLATCANESATVRGSIVLNRSEAVRLRDIIDSRLSGNYDLDAYKRFETEWVPTLAAARDEILQSETLPLARAIALAKHIVDQLTPKTDAYFIVGDRLNYPAGTEH